ncbi:MAG: hypothetical protein AAF922_12595 [Pseudomonadota bacterium]
MHSGSSNGGVQETLDKRDLTFDILVFVMDVTAFDCADGFNTAECRLGNSQGPEALPVSEKPFHGSVAEILCERVIKVSSNG